MNRPYFATTALAIPQNGQLVTPIDLDFSAETGAANGGAPVFDLSAELMAPGGMGMVSGIFIDNGANNDNLTLNFANTSNEGFILRIAGKVQAWQPLLLPEGSCRFTALSVVAALRKVQLHLLNFPVMPMMWNVP